MVKIKWHDFSAGSSTAYIPAWVGRRPDIGNYLTLGPPAFVMYQYMPRYAGGLDAGWVYPNAPDKQVTGYIPDSNDMLAREKEHARSLGYSDEVLRRYQDVLPTERTQRAIEAFKPVEEERSRPHGRYHIELVREGYLCQYVVGGNNCEWFLNRVSCEFVCLCELFTLYHDIRGSPDNSQVGLHIHICGGPSWWAHALPHWIGIQDSGLREEIAAAAALPVSP